MRYFFSRTFIFFSCSLFSWSCGRVKVESKKCLPAIVMIGYLGMNNKPTYPLVIRTNENDTSYLDFIGFEKEKFKRTGFLTSKEYYRVSTLRSNDYLLLKSYIVAHNTNKQRTIYNADANTIKIILFDNCDSLAYTVNKEDTGYFSNMIDTLELNLEDDKLYEYIKYYHEIQEWDGPR